MHPSLNHLDHRPWPIPSRPWAWRQSWRDLLFAHWPIPASHLQPLLPRGLAPQEFDGSAWIAIVPFQMAGVMRRPFPALPWISAFPELNVRTYVERDGKPGVWFFSLDATNPLAVWAARRFFHLPYLQARMSVRRTGDRIRYRSDRRDAHFEAWYEPDSQAFRAAPGSLEHWLTERYCLYAEDKRGGMWRTEVHHPAWPLQKAKGEVLLNTMLSAHGLQAQGAPTLLHFARRVDVVAWPSERIA